MDISQDQMDTSVLNDTQNDTTFSTTQNETTLNTTISNKPIRDSIKLPSNYMDIDDILSMNERVPCIIEQDLIKMGYLDQSTDDEHLMKGTKLELPLWFAKEFFSKQVNVIKVDTPIGYNKQFREIFEADATVIDLNKICYNFYKFGEHLMELEFDNKEKEEISYLLESTFRQRIDKIFNYSLNAKSEFVDDGVSFKKRLDNEENRLYNLGKKELDHYQKWEENQLHKIDTNDLIVNIRKRKQAALQAGF